MRTDQPGFSAQEIHGKLGLRAADTAELSLDGVEGELLGEIGDGFKVAMSSLDSGATASRPAAWASARARSTPR